MSNRIFRTNRYGKTYPVNPSGPRISPNQTSLKITVNPNSDNRPTLEASLIRTFRQHGLLVSSELAGELADKARQYATPAKPKQE